MHIAPGHVAGKVHVFPSVPLPAQLLPPLDGAGSLQDLPRCWDPVPHVAEHDDQVVHGDQLPSTERH